MKQISNIQPGMVLIPDISGYSKFVHTTDLQTAAHVSIELLQTLIDMNLLGMEAAEIEGDAILFYKNGTPPPVSSILYQYEHMLTAFNKKMKELNVSLGIMPPLSLKLIVHYGPIIEYHIRGFHRLFGETVIESHRLLKNSIHSKRYVLITNSFMEAAGSKTERASGTEGSKLCEVYGDLHHICYSYFDYTHHNYSPANA